MEITILERGNFERVFLNVETTGGTIMDLKIGKMEEVKLYSQQLGEEVELIVYTPAGATPLFKHSILIVQDGRDYFNLGRIHKTLEELSQKDKITPSLIVGIPYKDKYERWEKYHPSGEKHQQYVRFLAHELVPFLDENYPTNHMGLGRILVGDSLGATVSLLTALEYPHTFGKVIMQSPMVNEEVLEKTAKFNQPHLIELYHVIGTGETAVDTTKGTVEDFLTPNRKLHKVIEEKGIPHFYDEFEGDHTWKYWQPDLKRALEKILG